MRFWTVVLTALVVVAFSPDVSRAGAAQAASFAGAR